MSNYNLNHSFKKSPSTKYCKDCGSQINIKAEICPHCGVRQENNLAAYSSNKNRLVAAFVAFFLGGLGIHKFYLGQTLAGVLYLLFFWTAIPAFLGLIECIMYLLMSDEKFTQKYITGK